MTGAATSRPVGRFAYWMRALGDGDLPPTVELGGRRLRHVVTVKHDFVAATGFFEDEAGARVVLKVNRTAPFAGLSLRWLGRWLSRREARFHERLAGVAGVPGFLGPVGHTGLIRAFVPGTPLTRQRPVPDGFFDELRRVMSEVHARNIAHLDANKPENILLGDDGRPYLIDFQISVGGGRWSRRPPGRWWLRRLQAEDVYHLLKHKRRFRLDELTSDELARVRHRSALIRLHRAVSHPYRIVRRRLLGWLRRTGRVLPSGSN